MAGITRKRASNAVRAFWLFLTVILVAGLLQVGPGARPASAQVEGEESFAVGLMKSMANGAAGDAGGDLFGWVLGSAGSTDQDVQVLNEILDELDTIENTLVGIENEIAQLIDVLEQLDCDEWVQTALPMVNAISNLWDPNSISAGGPGAPQPQQSYVGITAETQSNTVTVADMEAWVDQVLNSNGAGINGLSILDYVQDLGNVLIPPAGGSGIIQSCLGVASNGPSKYKGMTDDAYYNDVVAPLVGYYYTIQTQGMTMVVEALNFEAWQAAGSPKSTTQTIEGLPEAICGDPSGQVLQYCENADWVVLGTNGTSGVRGRVAAQLTLGGAGYTWPGQLGEAPVHRYVSTTDLWASDPELFTTRNSPNCNEEMNSHAPCGILSGIYSNTTVGGTYGFYGAGEEGTWVAASGPQLTSIFQNAPDFNTNFHFLGDYLTQKRGFSPMPPDVIFVTNQVADNYPYGPDFVYNDVITFTDTGLIGGQFPPLFNPTYHGNYFNTTNALQVRVRSSGGCDYYATSPVLPSASALSMIVGGGARPPLGRVGRADLGDDTTVASPSALR